MNVAVEPRHAELTVRRLPAQGGGDVFLIYDDAEGASVGQAELLRRSTVLALLSRAMSDGSFVAAYGDDDRPGTLYRLEVARELGDDSDLATSLLLAPVFMKP